MYWVIARKFDGTKKAAVLVEKSRDVDILVGLAFFKAVGRGIEIYTEACLDNEKEYVIADTLPQLFYLAFHDFDLFNAKWGEDDIIYPKEKMNMYFNHLGVYAKCLGKTFLELTVQEKGMFSCIEHGDDNTKVFAQKYLAPYLVAHLMRTRDISLEQAIKLLNTTILYELLLDTGTGLYECPEGFLIEALDVELEQGEQAMRRYITCGQ